jgi:hypothetical protein
VPDGPAAAQRQIREIGVVRKLIEEWLIERRHLSVLERDPVKQADDAFAHRAQLVAAYCRERDAFKMRSPFLVPDLIVALEIALDDQTPPPHDDYAVDVGGLPAEDELIEPLADVGRESRLGGRRRLPLVRHRGARQSGMSGERGGGE